MPKPTWDKAMEAAYRIEEIGPASPYIVASVIMETFGYKTERSVGEARRVTAYTGGRTFKTAKPKRKLSAWNKFVKANSKKPRFRYRNGKLNLKKMAVAFRKTPAGRKKRR